MEMLILGLLNIANVFELRKKEKKVLECLRTEKGKIQI